MRIARLGAGTLVLLAEVNAARLGTAIRTVLTQPTFRDAAQSAAREIAKLPPTTAAVRVIEQVLVTIQARAKEYIDDVLTGKSVTSKLMVIAAI